MSWKKRGRSREADGVSTDVGWPWDEVPFEGGVSAADYLNVRTSGNQSEAGTMSLVS